jgi:uncharacterized protein
VDWVYIRCYLVPMTTNIFVNLPVKDLDRSVDFFTKLGYTFNPQFTDENATCMIIGDNIYAMLLLEPFFQTFTKKQLVNANTHTEAILAVSMDSKEEVDSFMARVLAAGGVESNDPEDQGFMYSRGYQDLDGHLWDIFWMDPAAVE